MAYKAIIFDFFDVIHRDPFNHWLKQSGLERAGELQKTSRLLDRGDIEQDEYYKRLGDISGQHPDNIRDVYDDTDFIDTDMVELIKSLKRHYKTGLLSNSSIKYIRGIIEKHDIEHIFDVITVSAEVQLIKPDPAIFEHILDKLEVKTGEAIFIDDNPKNVEAASKLGITGIVYKDMASLKQSLSELNVS